MRMRRLGWAGVEIECAGETLLIDYVQNTATFADVLRGPGEPFPPSSRPGTTAVALVTHLHGDHADPVALATALRPGAPVYRSEAATGNEDDLQLTTHAEKTFAEQKLATDVVAAWDERAVGPFKVFSAPAIDGSGDPQITWIVECGGRRFLHAGDTMFHGFWWRIAHRYGPFDIAFLPINGPVVQFPVLRPASGIKAVMSPEEAAAAANILAAKCVVPIHYGSLNKPPFYVETERPTERLQRKAEDFGFRAIIAEPGNWFEPD